MDSKALQQYERHRQTPTTDTDKKRIQRNVLRHKARVSVHLRPEATKYRAAALDCLMSAHRYLRFFREEQARFRQIRQEGGESLWARSLMARARKEGGDREYLRMLLFFARSYLASARRFGELADKFYLP